jgi:hypothetical protein
MFRQTTLLSHLPKKGKGFETAYVDTATAIQKENGLDDLKKVAKAAGVSDEDLETAIAQKGHLAVPVEVYAQSKASPELLESVSFSADTDSMARMKEHAKEIREAMTEAHEEAVKQQIDIMEAILGEWFPVAENAGEDMKRRMEREKDMAGAAILTRMDNPMQGWHELYKKAKQARQAMLQPALDALARGMKQGVDIIQNEDGSGVRVSNNEQWYRDFYKEHGRAPTQTELLDMARAMVAGEATAPKVEGWWLTNLSESEAKGMEQQKAELGQLDENIETLESIKERMKELDGVELKLTAGLTAEGYSVYRRIMADLKSIGGTASKAARMNAVLLARHADLYAKAITEKTGKKFTALDYYHTFAIQAGREGDAADGLYQRTVEKEKEAVRKQYAGTALWMKAPNGEATNLTEDQWLTVRTPAFKAWFGDWEQVATQHALEESVPLTISKELFALEGKELRRAAKEVYQREYQKNGDAISVSTRDGRLIALGMRGFREIRSHSADSLVLRIVPNIREIVENGQFLFSGAVEKKNRNKVDNTRAFHYYAAKVAIAGDEYYVRFVVREYTNQSLYYDHDLTTVETIEKDADFSANPDPKSGGEKSTSFIKNSIAKWWADVKDIKSSKVVDENGEPLVVYHGSDADFDVFDRSKGRTNMDIQGMFFSPWELDSKGYGTNVRAFFLNVRNPANEGQGYKALNRYQGQNGAGIKAREDLIAAGFDGVNSSDEEFIAFEPNQIKSATDNTGAFSAMDENIYHQSNEIVSRAEERLRADEKSWNALIDRYDAADKRKWEKEENGTLFHVMDVPLVLQILNIPYDSLHVFGSFFAHSVNKNHKGMTLDLLRQLPRKMADPLMITRGNKPDSYVFAVGLKDANGATIVVPVEINKNVERDGATANIINSAFGKTAGKKGNKASLKWFEKQFNNNNVLYMNKKESITWLQSYWNGSPAIVATSNALFASIVSGNFQNVKTETDLEAVRRSSFGVYQRVRNANQGRIVKNSAGGRVIELFEGADASTFLHEMGHMFLMDLEDLARLEDAASKRDLVTVDEWAAWHEGAAKDYEGSPWEEEFKAREQAILDAHAAGDVLTEKKLKEEWRHERFARGFELYLREGKAPSSSLRSVFRKFKEFLRRIYKTAISLGARPSAKVEAVMARMVATEEEIRAASLDERYRSVEEAGGEKLFTESERETYERWRREAEEDAEEALRVLVMRDLEERGRKEIAESVQEEERRAREALENDPVYMAEAAMEASGDADVVLHWFASREDFLKERARRKSLEEELKAHVQAYAAKKEQEMIASHFTEEKIAEAMESPEGYKKRLSLEAAAYRRKERLLSRVGKKADAAMEELEAALKAAPEHLDFTAEKDTEEAQRVQKAAARLRYGAKWDAKESQEIDDLRRAGTREEMAERLGAFREKVQKKRQKERGGKQRVQGEEEASNWRAFEEELLQRERVFRETAEGILRQRPLAESCNPNFYRQRERRHARTAAKMVKAGRWDMARLAKENQAMSSACAFAAEQNKEKLEKLLAGVKKKLGAKTVRLAAQERYWLHHLAYFLRLKDRDAQVPAEGAKDLTTMFHGYEESLDVSAGDAPATLLNVLLSGEFSGYSSLTLDEFAGAVNVMNILYTVGRDMFKMKSIKGKDMQDVVAEIMASKSRLAPKPVEEHAVAPDAGGVGYNDVLARVPGIGEKMAQIGQQGSLNMMKPELMASLLGEEAHKYIYGLYEKAQMQEAELLGESQSELERAKYQGRQENGLEGEYYLHGAQLGHGDKPQPAPGWARGRF